MRTRAPAFALFAESEFFTSLNDYEPEQKDFISIAVARLSPGYECERHGLWFYCNVRSQRLPEQGWKIHISATPDNARMLLDTVVPILLENRTSFKFVCDKRLLTLQNSKAYHRGASGKFITIYPRDQAHFLNLVARLDEATRRFEGPYILSDRRYGENRCLYYRYGTILSRNRLRADGRRDSVILAPDGSERLDERKPTFSLPEWVHDSLSRDHEQADLEQPSTGYLANGKYVIDEALAFSNSGGVYKARDKFNNDRVVVIKEARPFTNPSNNGRDAIMDLRNEFERLCELLDSGWTPRAFDYFKEWEHEFIVMQYIEGETLQSLEARECFLLRTRAGYEDHAKFVVRLANIFVQLASAVQAVHDRGIVIGDLSPRNVLVTPDGRICLIDFEGAWKSGAECRDLVTRGFAPRRMRCERDERDDYYSFSAMLLSYVYPINLFMGLLSDSSTHIKRVFGDAGLPDDLTDLVIRGLDVTPSQRPDMMAFQEVLGNMVVRPASFSQRDCPFEKGKVVTMLRETIRFIESTQEDHDDASLYPTDYRVHDTNPLSIAYGACGVLFALNRLGREIPESSRLWLDKNLALHEAELPPGFAIGRAGIAWYLHSIGRTSEARRHLVEAAQSALLDYEFGLFRGRAGVALAALKVYLDTRDLELRDIAYEQIKLLTAARRYDEHGNSYWLEEERIELGFMHGAAGIALLYLYAALALGEEALLHIGGSALRHDVSHARQTEDGWSLPYRVGYNYYYCPYVEYGSAGLLSSIVRYQRVTPSEDFRLAIEKLAPDIDRRYTMLPGRFAGLSGLGSANLDAYAHTGDSRFRLAAEKCLEGIEFYAVKRRGGTAFPGAEPNKLSCDYGHGSSGIALFLDRMVHGTNLEFGLDEYFSELTPIDKLSCIDQKESMCVGQMV